MRRAGHVIAVVGPSGVGKDSVMQGLAAAVPGLACVRRVITRPQQDGTEAFDAATPEAFDALLAAGHFCLHWGAHDLRYGIPARVCTEVAAGACVLVNLSRAVLPEAAALWPALTVLHLTAAPETLRRRLSSRGRETDASIRARLSRSGAQVPAGLHCVTVANDGALADTIAAARAALHPVLLTDLPTDAPLKDALQ